MTICVLFNSQLGKQGIIINLKHCVDYKLLIQKGKECLLYHQVVYHLWKVSLPVLRSTTALPVQIAKRRREPKGSKIGQCIECWIFICVSKMSRVWGSILRRIIIMQKFFKSKIYFSTRQTKLKSWVTKYLQNYHLNNSICALKRQNLITFTKTLYSDINIIQKHV